ncbi:MAG: tetratricopeptide repeat protein [Myxococcota bacterium]
MDPRPCAAGLPALLLVVALGACGPRTADVAMHEGIAAHRDGDHPRAEARYRKALSLDPGAAGAWNNLALLALADGELTQAVRLLEEELDRHPQSDSARLNRALVLLRLGRAEDAAEVLEPMAGFGGGLPSRRPEVILTEDRARTLLALSHWQQGVAPEDVQEPARRVLEREVPRGQPVEGRAAVLALARRVVAWQAARDGRWADVVATWPDVGPEARSDRLLLAWAQWRTGAHDQAVEALGPAEEDAAPRSRVFRAHLLTEAGRADEARDVLDGLPDEVPPPVRVAAERLLATLDAHADRWDDALTHLDAALEAAEEPPSGLWVSRAVALARTGRVDEARLVVAGVLRDDPDHAEARALHDLLR